MATVHGRSEVSSQWSTLTARDSEHRHGVRREGMLRGHHHHHQGLRQVHEHAVPSEAASVSVSTEPIAELAEIDTLGLAPMQHVTRQGFIAIDTQGDVVVRFGQHRQHELRILADGSGVGVYALGRAACVFPLHQLPRAFHGLYSFAASVVALVRSKTPRVTYHSPRARCVLFANQPLPDAELVLYDGGRVVYTAKTLTLTVSLPNHASRRSPITMSVRGLSQRLGDADPRVRAAVDHFFECFQACQEADYAASLAGRSFPISVRAPPSPWQFLGRDIGWCHRDPQAGSMDVVFVDGVRISVTSDADIGVYVLDQASGCVCVHATLTAAIASESEHLDDPDARSMLRKLRYVSLLLDQQPGPQA